MNRLLSQLARPLVLLFTCTLLPAAAMTASAASLSVFSFGSNNSGRTGLATEFGNTLVATPIVTSNMGGRAIMQVAAGDAHNLLLAEDGSVLSFGSNGFGEAGLGTLNEYVVLVATPIDASNLGGRKITQVAAGNTHSLLLAEDGSVFSFGDNRAGGTGLGETSGYTLVATPIDASNLGGRKITQMDAGVAYSLLLAEDGSVFSFGINDGRTGVGTTSGDTLVATPIDATNLGGRKITQVAAGVYHSLLLAEDGSVFSFGTSFDGETGLGTAFGRTLIATPIDSSNLGGRKITQVAAGSDHSLLLAEDGSVFSFGENRFGETGLGTAIGNTLIATPIDASNLGGHKITQVAAGEKLSLLLAEDGSVFSFGSNNDGQTGLGTAIGNTLIATPIVASNLGGHKITQVAAGYDHSLLIVAIPEPASLVLAGVLALALLGLPRRSHWRLYAACNGE